MSPNYPRVYFNLHIKPVTSKYPEPPSRVSPISSLVVERWGIDLRCGDAGAALDFSGGGEGDFLMAKTVKFQLAIPKTETEMEHLQQTKWYIYIYTYIPGTHMTLVLIEKGLVLGGWPSIIEVIWVPGIYIYIYNVEIWPCCNMKAFVFQWALDFIQKICVQPGILGCPVGS